MQYPDILKPQSTQHIVLPSGRAAHVPKATPFFRKWTGAVPENTYNNKPIPLLQLGMLLRGRSTTGGLYL